MATSSVEIWGAGLAGQCCALALASQGRSVRLIASEASSAAKIDPARVHLFDAAAIELAATLGVALSIKPHARVLSRRWQRWGQTAGRSLETQAWLVSEVDLLSILRSRIDATDLIELSDCPGAAPEWTVLAGLNDGRYAGSDPRAVIPGGQRQCLRVEVELTDGGPDEDHCLESFAGGWLQLCRHPERVDRGELQVMGFDGAALAHDPATWLGHVHASIATSERFAAWVRVIGEVQRSRAAPYFPVPVLGRLEQGEYWLGIGASAAGFDPISGEGLAFELRSALLAAATITGLGTGALRPEASTRHYEGQIARGLLAHLRACEQRYAEACPDVPACGQELEASREARRLITAQVHPLANEALPYRLQNGDLVAVGQN